MGYNYTDLNGVNQVGHMPFQLNTKYGRRQDSATAFLYPYQKQRKNLVVLSKALATKILINRHKEAYGVMFTYNRVLYRALAKKEVIVCAGAINSPQLLMLSGIGPKSHLSKLGTYNQFHIKLNDSLNIFTVRIAAFLLINQSTTFYGL